MWLFVFVAADLMLCFVTFMAFGWAFACFFMTAFAKIVSHALVQLCQCALFCRGGGLVTGDAGLFFHIQLVQVVIEIDIAGSALNTKIVALVVRSWVTV